MEDEAVVSLICLNYQIAYQIIKHLTLNHLKTVDHVLNLFFFKPNQGIPDCSHSIVNCRRPI